MEIFLLPFDMINELFHSLFSITYWYLLRLKGEVNVSLLVVFFSKVNATLHQIERLKGYYYQTINNDIFCDKGEIGC